MAAHHRRPAPLREFPAQNRPGIPGDPAHLAVIAYTCGGGPQAQATSPLAGHSDEFAIDEDGFAVDEGDQARAVDAPLAGLGSLGQYRGHAKEIGWTSQSSAQARSAGRWVRRSPRPGTRSATGRARPRNRCAKPSKAPKR